MTYRTHYFTRMPREGLAGPQNFDRVRTDGEGGVPELLKHKLGMVIKQSFTQKDSK